MINIKVELYKKLHEIEKHKDDIRDLYISVFLINGQRFIYKQFDEIPYNIIYDNGHGRQNLFGYVLFKDKTWLERAEYDGAEEWDYKSIKLIKLKIKELQNE